ncbi:hypothetical protein M408DRAFT_153929 [Serendipita vermifera MAFF 305830]|uniref:Uncharacterized protein n=1 Tax=Serendipita vermifera MAFF 305830 TaxID=933852 RepID=A0A0C3BMS1_SERVB|nr:hypothetical protein M408DRAFT_153929 [Serendipita vermifera MAFF 305830]
MATTLYGTTTVTTTYTTYIPRTTTLFPYRSTVTTVLTGCAQSSGSSCASTYSMTGEYIDQRVSTRTITASVAQTVALTTVTSYPTSTISSPSGSGALPCLRLSKAGMVLSILLLSSLLTC